MEDPRSCLGAHASRSSPTESPRLISSRSLSKPAGFEFAFATARTFVFRGFEATARAVLRSVDYMSLMLFYMANSFHLARTPKLRLAHLKRPAPSLGKLGVSSI